MIILLSVVLAVRASLTGRMKLIVGRFIQRQLCAFALQNVIDRETVPLLFVRSKSRQVYYVVLRRDNSLVGLVLYEVPGMCGVCVPRRRHAIYTISGLVYSPCMIRAPIIPGILYRAHAPGTVRR